MPDLDLSTLLSDDLIVRDTNGRDWVVKGDVPFRMSLSLYKVAQGATEDSDGTLDYDDFRALVDGLYAILKRGNPEATREDVMDAFSMESMLALVSFLYNRDASVPTVGPEQAGASTTTSTRRPRR